MTHQMNPETNTMDRAESKETSAGVNTFHSYTMSMEEAETEPGSFLPPGGPSSPSGTSWAREWMHSRGEGLEEGFRRRKETHMANDILSFINASTCGTLEPLSTTWFPLNRIDDDELSEAPDEVWDEMDFESLLTDETPVFLEDDVPSEISGSSCESTDPEPLSTTRSPVDRIEDVVPSAISGSSCESTDPEPLSTTWLPVNRIDDDEPSAMPDEVWDEMDFESLLTDQTPVFLEDNVPSAISGSSCESTDPEPLSTTRSPVDRIQDVVPSAIPQSNCKKPQDATAEEERKKAIVRIFVEALVSRTLREAGAEWTEEDSEAVIASLFEGMWIRVQHHDLNPKACKKLDKAVFQELHEKWGCAKLLLCSMKSAEPYLMICIASSVHDHLTAPPKQRSTIRRFFSSVGRAISDIFRWRTWTGLWGSGRRTGTGLSDS